MLTSAVKDQTFAEMVIVETQKEASCVIVFQAIREAKMESDVKVYSLFSLPSRILTAKTAVWLA